MAGERDRLGCFWAACSPSKMLSETNGSVFEAKSAEFSMPSSYGLATVIHWQHQQLQRFSALPAWRLGKAALAC